MVINENKKFVFVHVYKNGGSSIERALGGRTTTHGESTHTKLYQIPRLPDYEDYFSFAFVRNPWDRLLSAYFYGNRKQQKKLSKENFKRWLMNLEGEHKSSIQKDRVRGCKFIGRFEYLQDDFDKICKMINVAQSTLPHYAKTSHKHYTEYYTEEMIEKVKKYHSGDIEYFGFTFEGTATKNIGLIK